MKKIILIFLFPLSSFSQTLFTTSNLPIVVINTNGQLIMDDPRIVCDMGVIDNGFGNINSINDPFNDYNGKISIEYRGSSSQSFPKKSYSFETQLQNGNNNNVSLLGLPVENDWILYAPYSDKSLMRNFLIYNLSIEMGNYAPRTVYCELIVNGDYKGVYVLMEKIKRDNDRVDIAKLDSNDNYGDSLTGGYILKIDKFTANSSTNSYWQSNYQSVGGNPMLIQYHYPEFSDITTHQINYIKAYVDSFENVLSSTNFADAVNGYRKYIDYNSFIDLYILNEFSRNIDGYRLSTFMYKDRNKNGGKLKMGPIWDYNLAFGNAYYCDGWNTQGWQRDGNCADLGSSPFWFERLLDDSLYLNNLNCRWNLLRKNSLNTDTIFSFIDSMVMYLNNSQTRNFQRWPILGSTIWPNYYVGGNYQDEINFLKNWIFDRIIWIDNNIPGNCIDLGCMDSTSYNYSPLAIIDDGSCCYVSGCTDSNAINYDSLACYNDSSCQLPILGCLNPNASNFDSIANVNSFNGGPMNNLFGSGGYFNGSRHLVFNSYKNCKIKEATFYTSGNGVVTFELRDSSGIVIDDTTHTLIAGKQTLTLNFDVGISNNYQLGISGSSDFILYRNNSDVSYPYSIADAIEVISSSAASPLDYYYYYYDINIEIPCLNISPTSFNCDVQGYCFDPRDGSGIFSKLIDCQDSCNSLSANEILEIEELTISPNPSNGFFNVSFFSNSYYEIGLSVKNMIGDVLYFKNIYPIKKNHKLTLNLKNYISGVYFVEIKTKNKTYNKKIVIK